MVHNHKHIYAMLYKKINIRNEMSPSFQILFPLVMEHQPQPFLQKSRKLKFKPQKLANNKKCLQMLDLLLCACVSNVPREG